jgi:hypothetical protein
MSILVKCTITVSNEQYEAGTKHEEIFTVWQNASSTGVFSGTHGKIIKHLIESASNMAVEQAVDKLQVMKGDINNE